MKKKVLFVASLFLATLTFAQDGLTSKKGEAYLPEAGDWAIGFDAAPWLDYAGNFFNSNSNSAPTAAWQTSDASIMAKMFKDENTAYRMRLRLGFGSTNTDNLVDTSAAVPPQPTYITNNTKTSYNAITIGGGIEKRRGNTRIQGLYGGELLISLSGSKTTNAYGVSMDSTSVADGWAVSGRVLESKAGSTFGVTARGFVGVEIFVFPKVSIAGEYGWGLSMSSTGEGTTTSEVWSLATPSATAPSVQQVETKTGKSSSFGIDTDNSGGQLNIMFHF